MLSVAAAKAQVVALGLASSTTSLRKAAVRRAFVVPSEPVWNGTENEMRDLLLAIQRNCSCVYDGSVLQQPCDVHRQPFDQRTLDKLLFMRRIASRLERGEFCDAV